jgi:hypothetical protein
MIVARYFCHENDALSLITVSPKLVQAGLVLRHAYMLTMVRDPVVPCSCSKIRAHPFAHHEKRIQNHLHYYYTARDTSFDIIFNLADCIGSVILKKNTNEVLITLGHDVLLLDRID